MLYQNIKERHSPQTSPEAVESYHREQELRGGWGGTLAQLILTVPAVNRRLKSANDEHLRA